MRKSPFEMKIQRKKQKALSNFALTTALICFLFSTVSVAQIMPQEEPLSDSEKQEIELKGKKERPEWLDKVHYGGNIWGGFRIFYITSQRLRLRPDFAGLGATFVIKVSFGVKNQFTTSYLLSMFGDHFSPMYRTSMLGEQFYSYLIKDPLRS
jgi:hypothetical protein